MKRLTGARRGTVDDDTDMYHNGYSEDDRETTTTRDDGSDTYHDTYGQHRCMPRRVRSTTTPDGDTDAYNNGYGQPQCR
ncbi:hypothetical protein CVT25_002485 [Psilocybe cyanescens]|uniref:Uncharacterized protein n=1 Tax=Psilocybe cyanescens TaxID=93625 RepID=A0A409X4J5_PSICY|nr:hypothetical protein CVT25_002485 [Psilocybe cyanescens]